MTLEEFSKKYPQLMIEKQIDLYKFADELAMRKQYVKYGILKQSDISELKNDFNNVRVTIHRDNVLNQLGI